VDVFLDEPLKRPLLKSGPSQKWSPGTGTRAPTGPRESLPQTVLRGGPCVLPSHGPPNGLSTRAPPPARSYSTARHPRGDWSAHGPRSVHNPTAHDSTADAPNQSRRTGPDEPVLGRSNKGCTRRVWARTRSLVRNVQKGPRSLLPLSRGLFRMAFFGWPFEGPFSDGLAKKEDCSRPCTGPCEIGRDDAGEAAERQKGPFSDGLAKTERGPARGASQGPPPGPCEDPLSFSGLASRPKRRSFLNTLARVQGTRDGASALFEGPFRGALFGEPCRSRSFHKRLCEGPQKALQGAVRGPLQRGLSRRGPARGASQCANLLEICSKSARYVQICGALAARNFGPPARPRRGVAISRNLARAHGLAGDEGLPMARARGAREEPCERPSKRRLATDRGLPVQEAPCEGLAGHQEALRGPVRGERNVIELGPFFRLYEGRSRPLLTRGCLSTRALEGLIPWGPELQGAVRGSLRGPVKPCSDQAEALTAKERGPVRRAIQGPGQGWSCASLNPKSPYGMHRSMSRAEAQRGPKQDAATFVATSLRQATRSA